VGNVCHLFQRQNSSSWRNNENHKIMLCVYIYFLFLYIIFVSIVVELFLQTLYSLLMNDFLCKYDCPHSNIISVKSSNVVRCSYMYVFDRKSVILRRANIVDNSF